MLSLVVLSGTYEPLATPLKLVASASRLSRLYHFGQRLRGSSDWGEFWQSRYKAVRLVDDEALLACAAYVDLNPIRAGAAETLEDSDHTSALRRIQALEDSSSHPSPDRFLAPVELTETHREEPTEPAGPAVAKAPDSRCDDRGFLNMSAAEYLQLLDFTAREIHPGKRGATPQETPLIFERLKLRPQAWLALVKNFGRLFRTLAGRPENVDATRSRASRRRFHLTQEARELMPLAG